MSNNPNAVSLDVRNFSTSGDGWTNVNAANGQPYSYKYTGGDSNSNNGQVTFMVNGGQAAITVNLIADARYQFVGGCISFVNDPNNQLSTAGNAPRTRVVNGKCSAALNGQYKALVTDTTANTTIQCDPIVINEMPPM